METSFPREVGVSFILALLGGFALVAVAFFALAAAGLDDRFAMTL